MQVSQKCIDLIKGVEQCKEKAYLDLGGTPSIGYGTTHIGSIPVTLNMELNEPVAYALLYLEIDDCLKALSVLVKVPINQNQIDALISLMYNIGINAFKYSSLITAINYKLPIEEDLFTRWNKVRVNGVYKTIPGLIARRKKEYQLFMEKL